MSDNFIIAIDFGTAFSGYAYSLTLAKEEIKPYLRRWGHEFGQDAPKAPTCILFDENEVFIAFGHEAMNTYVDMDKEANNCFFFKDFKMELYGKRITKNLSIQDVNKKEMNALRVFSECLRFLKEDAVKTINNSTDGFQFTASDFTWVLTVPAIWDFSARQFMREAAVKAGIVSKSTPEKLVIALEPEAASVWSRTLPSEGFISEESGRTSLAQSPGTQYIVVDCGGGTIDITVHEVLENGELKELHKASGNDKGGQTVDRKFKECLREFFCDGQWDEYERVHPGEAQKFMYDFAFLKQIEKKKELNIICDNKLGKIVDCKGKLQEMDGLKWKNGRIVISNKRMESLFQDSMTHIKNSIKEILKKQGGTEYILLVGGFAQSHILRQCIRSEFGDQAKVLCPKNPQEAIVKGALVFGRDQSVISSRKSAYTYGVNTTEKFKPSIHKAEKKFTADKGDYCSDIFKKLVEVDEDIGWNETREYTFFPVKKTQKKVNFSFFRTKRQNVTYTDDWGVEGPVGSCEVDSPDSSKGTNREIKLEVFLGATEITSKATDVESKSTASVNIDLITN